MEALIQKDEEPYSDFPKPQHTIQETAQFLNESETDFERAADRALEVYQNVTDRFEKEDPLWKERNALGLVKQALQNLRHYLENPEAARGSSQGLKSANLEVNAKDPVTWDEPFIELQYPVRWSWEERRVLFGTLKPEDLPPAFSSPEPDARETGEESGAAPQQGDEQGGREQTGEQADRRETAGKLAAQEKQRIRRASEKLTEIFCTHRDVETFRALIGDAAYIRRGEDYGKMLPQDVADEVNALDEAKQKAALDELYKPVIVSGGAGLVQPITTTEGTGRVQEPKPDLVLPSLALTDDVDGKPFRLEAVVVFQPLIVDADEETTFPAFYPVTVGLMVEGEAGSPKTWSEEDRRRLWDLIFNQIDKELKEAFQETEKPETSETGTLPVPRAVSPPPRRRSVMSPIPVPRAAVKDASALKLTRGIGRMFSGLRKVPDLDLRGEPAIREAERLFWEALEEDLGKNAPGDFHLVEEAAQKVLYLRGIQEREARNYWNHVTAKMNKTAGGPGLNVAPPAFENKNRVGLGGKVVVETAVRLWLEENLKNRYGETEPPVRFRTEKSPGYLALLEKNGDKPYFADGWLWISRGGEREGFRIAGLPTLLFPEGQAALKKLRERNARDYEAEVHRIFREPSLFKDEDKKTVQDLQAAIRRAREEIAALSIYEDGPDLIYCIFEAFHRQRNAWYAEKIVLSDGKEVSTNPYGRYLCIDPKDLRVRLDPAGRWGKNWRSVLFNKLEALTTFQRQTRDRKGRKVDVGDQFLRRVISGKRDYSSKELPEDDSTVGILRVLKNAGAIPSDALFVEVSADFMVRLVTWAVDEKGLTHWGLDAAKATERAALASSPSDKRGARRAAEEKRKKARKEPYFDYSPRLAAVGNLDGWPRSRKDLALVLLQEVTPNFFRYRDKSGTSRKRRKPNRRGGKAMLHTIDGEDFVLCNGSAGKGYRLRIWIRKAGYETRRGPGGGVRALSAFVEDLRALHEAIGLQVRFKGSIWDMEKTLEALKVFERNLSAHQNAVLQALLPADIEDRLRERLSEAGIDAVDEDEVLPKVFRPSGPDGVSPAEIRIARTRAGWTQAELAGKVGVSRVMVAYWENARKPIPEDRMKRILEVLKSYLDPSA